MGDSDVLSAVAHAVLTATSSWALQQTHFGRNYDFVSGNEEWVTGTFALHFVHGIVGVVNFVAPSDTINAIYDHTTFLSTLFAVPCLATHMHLGHGTQKELAWLHVGCAVIPLLGHYSRRGDERFLDTVLAGSLISLGFLTVTTENYMGLGAALCYAVNFFVLTAGGDAAAHETAIDRYTYLLSLFNYLAVRGLSGK